MGGNALGKVLRRIDSKEFPEYQEKVLQILHRNGLDCKATKYYRLKPDFGDLDIIVKGDMIKSELNEMLSRDFYCDNYAYNDNCLSFEYDNFQVDLIFIHESKYDVAYDYYSYNDLNNFVGRIAARYNLSWGWEGLYWVIRNHFGNVQRRILITRDTKAVYEFLDLDWNKFNEGFDTLEEIFEWITSSYKFQPGIFRLDELNNQNRTRNRKRKNYTLFLKWLEERYEMNGKVIKFSDEECLEMINAHFKEAGLNEKIRDMIHKYEVEVERAKRFNGNIIMELTGLTGVHLGKFIVSFKESKGTNFNDWVDKHDDAFIKDSIVGHYNSLHLA